MKSFKKLTPNVFVIWSAPPRNMAKRKKISICFLLNKTNASKPNEETRLFLSFVLTGRHFVTVKEYMPMITAAAALT